MGTKSRLENVSEMSPNHWEVKLYALAATSSFGIENQTKKPLVRGASNNWARNVNGSCRRWQEYSN